MKTFRDKVIEHRAALGLSQQQLADKAGIGVRTIGNYESGARLPYAAQLYKLAKALGVSVKDIFSTLQATFGAYYVTLSGNADNASVARAIGLSIIMISNLFLVQLP